MLFKKFLGLRSPQTDVEDTSIEDTIARIQEGDVRLLNQVITDYQPYIAKAASRFCKRFVEPSRDEEFAVAMHAFHEAIQQFSPKEGRSFLGFAETVIRRRLIDHIRRERRHNGHASYSSFELEDEDGLPVNTADVHHAIDAYEKEKIAEERRTEIAEFSRELAAFDISFEELVRVSPKHADSREMMFRIARKIAGDPNMLGTIFSKKTMPIKELLEQVDVSRKTIERNRKYLIALTLVYSGHYPYLSDYLRLDSEEATAKEEKEG
ncbi:RNA polymerase sigma factor SigI [Xylanibacillus composti]|uniref:RNA polymerase sigma factor SigI n=1 Tax=Xylanibacillus composti TaxID=1572762 RepID=UPI001FD383AC|nr:RNA polymerase sigma factor SigI [Xylanibacillus composti]